MRIIETKTYEDMSKQAANIIASVVTLKPDCMLGLATGSSPIGTYEELVKKYEAGELDFSEVTTVNLDEYKGLPKENEQSYYYFMHDNLFDKVNIKPENILVVEDSKNGIIAATRANMHHCFIFDTIKPDDELKDMLEFEKDSMDEIIPLLESFK